MEVRKGFGIESLEVKVRTGGGLGPHSSQGFRLVQHEPLELVCPHVKVLKVGRSGKGLFDDTVYDLPGVWADLLRVTLLPPGNQV